MQNSQNGYKNAANFSESSFSKLIFTDKKKVVTRATTNP